MICIGGLPHIDSMNSAQFRLDKLASCCGQLDGGWILLQALLLTVSSVIPANLLQLLLTSIALFLP